MPSISFFLYTCTFMITFFGFFRNNMYIILYTFCQIEVYSFQNWQNRIEKFKWGKSRIIRKWRIWSLLNNYSPPIVNIFWNFFSMDQSYDYLKRFCRKFFLKASLVRNVPKRWYCAFFISEFRDMIPKVCYFLIEKFTNKFWVALLFEYVETKFCWKILKLLG